MKNYMNLDVHINSLQALDKCQLGDIVVHSKEGRLDSVDSSHHLSTVVENGENWSVGQSNYITSVDSATDGLIQMVINQEFRDRTVVTIAHRIHTAVTDSDLVLVLSDGQQREDCRILLTGKAAGKR
ncbi:hypothetical protein QQ045_002136 [Rhodiola kirilowii]